MGLSGLSVSYAISRSHVLLVEVPGWWATRVAVERDLLRRGWQVAVSPADAEVLVVCGEPGERLAEVVDRVWEQLPGPRARVAVAGADVAAAFDEAARQLADNDRQRNDARSRRNPVDNEDNGDGGDMDHVDMDMAPVGISLAGGGGDRDGLEMDVLHVPLGPVLPHWPPGLVLRCVLHGDVVAEAAVEVLEGAGAPPPAPCESPAVRAARACDAAARLLAVAGWDDTAAAARRVRDLLLSEGTARDQGVHRLDRLRSRVSRSWTLRWMLRGLGPVDETALRRSGLPGRARGDVHDRLVAMLDRAQAELRGEPAAEVADPGAALDALPGLVAGLELAAVRLVVASLDPDTAGAVPRESARA